MLSKGTGYAIRALVYIYTQNQKGEKPGFKEVAREINSPEQFTAKILQSLTRFELLKSARGRGGGFFFDPKNGELTLYEVIKVMEGKSFFTQCIFGFDHCADRQPCPLHEDFVKIWNDFRKMTENQTIQSLARKIENQEAYLNRLELN